MLRLESLGGLKAVLSHERGLAFKPRMHKACGSNRFGGQNEHRGMRHRLELERLDDNFAFANDRVIAIRLLVTESAQ